MNTNKKILIWREEILRIGKISIIESFFDDYQYGVVFEDDGETGYFYAINKDMEILDALHIYDVKNIIDKDVPSNVKILWLEDLSICILSINNYYHAMYNFRNQESFCRNNFPKSNGGWCKNKNRMLTDEIIKRI